MTRASVWRRQLPVATRITLGAVAAGAREALGASSADRAEIAARVAGAGADALLTDSGTSALVLALRATSTARRVVAMPAYACVDLVAAARRAGVRFVAYDVDPLTLSPDLDSIERVLASGVDAVVVAHLFGIPADVPAVIERARRHGAAVIEDAAQAAGGALDGTPLGALGSLAVLSFGRGKGTAGGGGGALVARDERWFTAIEEGRAGLPAGARGVASCGRLAAQWVLGRPSMYAIPSSLPSLRLGETVYHEPGEPRAISACSLAVLVAALDRGGADVERRRQLAATYRAALDRESDPKPRACAPITGAEPGYLRFPVIAADGRAAAPALGILRGYPRMIGEWEEARSIAIDRGEDLTGARELVRTLLTLPTHHFVQQRDVENVIAWLAAAPVRTARG